MLKVLAHLIGKNIHNQEGLFESSAFAYAILLLAYGPNGIMQTTCDG